MKIRIRLPVLVAAAALLAGVSVAARAQPQNDAAAIAVGAKDIGGVVSGPQGREAGVWVIAETTELPTQFRRIVVTDDQGRYLVPDLPQADYNVWVRGYGLVDSPKMRAKPGQRLDLAAAPAPNAADAAHPVGPVGPVHGEPARRAIGRSAVQIFCRLDRPHRQG